MQKTSHDETQAHSGYTIWLTGLSGAGKSTIANAFHDYVNTNFHTKVVILDGDVIRAGLNSNLGFSEADREENIRRIGEVAKLFNLNGFITIVGFISPYSAHRDRAKKIHIDAGLPFDEVYVSTSLEVCEKRDVKGLYAKARRGEIKSFTGISDPYEAPQHPDIVINTAEVSLSECVNILVKKILKSGGLVHRFHSCSKQVTKLTNDQASHSCEIEADEEELNWLQVIQQGWAPPGLKCFMNETQLLECLYFKTFTDEKGTSIQSVPIIYPINNEIKEKIAKHERIIITSKITKAPVAVIEKPSVYDFKHDEICAKVFGTTSRKHPKIGKWVSQGNFLLTGANIVFVDTVKFNDGLDHLRLSSDEIRALIKEKNADTVFAFQLRNPLHNGHCMLLHDTKKNLIAEGYKNPVLLLHPCGGWTKDDDVPLDVRIRQHEALFESSVLSREHTIMAIWPSPMYYAGPLEVMWHFSSRQYAGVDYMIVGRDPAGLKNPENDKEDLYDPTHGAKILDVAKKSGLLSLKILAFKVAAYNKKLEKMEYFDPSNKDDYDMISGSRMRQMARDGQHPPIGFMDQRGWEVLAEYYRSLK